MPTIKNKPVKPNEAFAEAIGAPKPAANLRAREVSLKGDRLKNYAITLENIDEAVLFHLKNVIQPFVIEDDSRVPVPIMYANPERWKSAQLDGGMRDKEGKVLFPVIVLKKESVEKNLELGNKLDGNKVHNYNIIEQRYTKKNQYDNFSVLTNRIPVKEYRMLPIPDYYTITYTCSVYVSNNADLNGILESIMYAGRSYWGDPNRFRFMVNIQDTPITQELNEGENRKIYSEFTLTLSGHVIPNSINQFMSTEKKFFSKAQLIFNLETDGITEEYSVNARQKKSAAMNTVYPEAVKVYNINISVGNDITTYLNNNKSKMVASDQIMSDRFYLRNTEILEAPGDLPPTSKDNFYVLVNGQKVTNTEVIDVVQVGNDVLVTLNVTDLGYTLKQDFEIEIIGKFV